MKRWILTRTWLGLELDSCCLETSDLENSDLENTADLENTDPSKIEIYYGHDPLLRFSYQFRCYLALIHSTGSSGDPILGDPGAASRDEGIFVGESSLQQGDERSSSCCSKLSPTKIPSSRPAAPGSPGMGRPSKNS